MIEGGKGSKKNEKKQGETESKTKRGEILRKKGL